MNIARQKPTPEQRTAREMLLDCHRLKIMSDYCIPAGWIHFDPTVSELMLDDTPLPSALFSFLKSERGSSRIRALRAQSKQQLETILNDNSADYRIVWNKQLDYESLVMEKMIDLDAVPCELLTVPLGRSFFEQHRKICLMHQGYQLSQTTDKNGERAQWFSQWNDEWFLSNAMTKHRLLYILHNYDDSWQQRFHDMNKPEKDTLDKTFEAMRQVYDRQRLSGAKTMQALNDFVARYPDMKHYAIFVTDAMEYNDELRLLRSRSAYRFIRGCEGKKGYAEFLNVLRIRQCGMEEQYGKQRAA